MLEASSVVSEHTSVPETSRTYEMGDWHVSVAIPTKKVSAREEFENVTLLLARNSFTFLRVSLFVLMN